MSRKTDEFYYANFVASMSVAREAAELLRDILKNFDRNMLPRQLEQMHEIEHKGDRSKHELVAELSSAFIAPLERDDMIELSQNIDNVTDSIEDILIHLYITNIADIRPGALQFTEVLIRCCNATKQMLEEFRHFKKSKELRTWVIEVNRIEEEGDELYINLMHELHVSGCSALEILSWREVYEFFEKCCDACEDVADIVESIAIGNT